MAWRSGREAREWILFLVGIGLVIYFASSRPQLDVGWLMLIGSMLGLSVLASGIRNTGSDDSDDRPDPPSRRSTSRSAERVTRIREQIEKDTRFRE